MNGKIERIIRAIERLSDMPRKMTEDNLQYDLGFNMGYRIATKEILEMVNEEIKNSQKQ